ncbi:acyl transferase domain-containing protein/NADPH:quinone reductase-like Zn-dependent oxidoreductase/acyl carrier protein/short-subunit dehydrogenase [Pararhizobium capsulatum DSM 1112]|uniref:Acyl transferase domain-containing protein/NADPH:quinone reductase-like Zn-dependent oxidoreductase/acyl carrier protein/short-subunit dehydrogenase n=1 Tax=Pararhizobium capsulatum DSM 1112 TaxID=1121113 RepID=A0ABU0BL07_9HYPH|nr:SDR family NAD(P)-dependent oxidoreductase [Pararhizobium capsulatum]MDQ0318929.1 acyl transferase domain-containing protein/NADPH:quinone reductase-like Zn-dependent oxidoreductase/acyl carrier protein/short-subunit dehydrogenase [Pararhizobium capsulatum DSM 1112]
MTVEIIGRACVAPGADSPQALFRLLRQGKCTVSSIPFDRWDLARFWHPSQGIPGKTYTFAAGVMDSIYNFDPAAFGMSQREAMHMDPQQRVLLQLAWRALEDANISIPSLHGENVGVYIGASSLDHANLTVQDPAAAGPYFMTGNTLSIVSNRISHIFGLSGPSMTIDTACSSSLVALDQAMRALDTGEIDTAIVGGVNILAHPLAFVGFAQARMLSPEGLCRAYDNNGVGYVRAEGGVVFVLRRSDRARQEKDRSYAKIIATGVNSAGRTNGISLPSRESQANLLRAIYEGNNIDSNQVAFVEGHGTGTKVGDPAEVWSIGTVIGANRRAPVPIGSIKSNIGHTEPASGLFGMLKAVMALENNYLPASLHFDTPNDNIDFDGLNVRVTANPIELLRGKRARLAGINSFGFGGANAHVVISDPDPVQEERQRNNATGHVFMASAHTASSLNELLKSYKARFGKTSREEVRSIIAASGANRTLMRHRFTARSDNPEDIVRAIANHLDKPASDIGEIGEAVTKDAKVAFVFSGNGSQWAGMGVEAFRENLHFRQCFTSVSALFKFHADISLIDLLNDPELDRKLADTKVAQPLLFAVQAALSDSLVAMGIKPTAVFGHSVGEIAAAYAAGALSLVDAVSIVAKRSLHQDLLAGQGTMAAVMLGEDAATAFATAHGFDNICVAAINAHNSVTISGPANEVSAYRDAARKAKIPAQVLDINYPFHHPIIDQAKRAFLSDIPDIAPRRSELAYISTVTGERLDGTQLDPDYWWKNVREPVRFQAATEAAIALGCTLFVEISPRAILASYLKETVKQAAVPGTVVSTLSRDTGEKGQDPVSRAMARAIAHGAAFEAGRLFGQRNAHIRLPELPFEATGLRPASTSDKIDLFGLGTNTYSLSGWRSDLNGGSWKNHIDAHLFPDLAEHVVDGKAIMPGSGFIEIAVSAAQQYYGTTEVDITNLEIVRPLELSDSRMMELSTIVSPETGDIEIRSRERLTEDDWAIHAVARSRKPIAHKETTAAATLAGLQATATVLPARAYETARQFGLDYGPNFQLMTKAVTYGDRFIDVELKAPAAAGHPFVTYSLNPISVDATFHGLVALFDRLSGDIGGAPYIPVRFGSVRVLNSGETIHRAIVEIERVSANSIKAKFRFYGKNGGLIAAFDDCRFRRTYLRQHKTLDMLSFHYEAVPSEARTQAKATALQLPLLVPATDTGIDNTTLLLTAAIYRACHEIALKLAKGKNKVDTRSLPGDFAFRCFLANCLYILEDAGLGEQKAGNWVIQPDFALPPVADILKEVYGERSERVVEAVLINDTYVEALERIDNLQEADKTGVERDEAHTPTFISEATLDHQAVHSPVTRLRTEIVLAAVEKALTSATAGQGLRIVEAGTVSSAFSRNLANLAARHQAALLIAEPRDNAQRNLEIAFEEDAHVRVLKKDELGTIPAFDLLVSASGSIFTLIDEDTALRGAIRAGLRPGGVVVAATNAPTVFSDFAFGLTENWFARSQAIEFPVGRLATTTQWQKCLDDLGLRNVSINDRETAYGNIIAVEAESGASSPAANDVSAAIAETMLVLHDSSFKLMRKTIGEIDAVPIALKGDLEADKSALLQAFASLSGKPLRAIYVAPERSVDALADSEVLQSAVLQLSAFAEAVRAFHSNAEPATHPRLALVLPGGAPVTAATKETSTAAVNSGLWTFARVLQNEYDNLDIHCLDFADVNTSDTASHIAAARSALQRAGANREWLVNDKTGVLSEIRAVPGPAGKALRRTRDFNAATIRQQVSSQVGSIAWEETVIPTAGPGEVVVKVAATGLNFRDVMWAMGLLPEEALEDGFAGATIGMELSGHVVAVGTGVNDLSAGDAIMAIAPAAFSTHAVVSRSGVARLPATVSPVAAATVPVAFLTAYYALMELGRIRAGETVLIHGAAGGVGLAALQIAKLAGAKVIATAGTREKRRFVTMLGADHVFDSRTLGFVEDVRNVTDGEGVDLVLNSLFSEAMEQSLGLVKPFGRFLELGKRDYYADSKIGLRPFRRNISYFGIDADQLLVNAPDLTKRIFTEIGTLFEEGKLVPLPYRAFNFDEIGNAFRLMQNAGHIGKIVVVPPVAGRDEIKRTAGSRLTIEDEGVHLVVGGIGGFGLAAANWLVEKGARNIALSTRRGLADQETLEAIGRWEKKGVSTTVHACDVTDEIAAADLLAQLRTIGPMKSVIHAAMVLDDALISNLDRARNKPVIDVKAKGAAVLDRLTRTDALDRFIMFSSATTLVGNPGQGNYVAANGYLEGLARARRKAGLPALAIGFGAIADAGYLAKNTDVNDLLSKRIGKTALKAQVALAQVEAYIRSDPGTVDAAVSMISELDWAAARNLPVVRNALFDVILRSADQNTQGGDGRSLDLVAMIEGKSSQEAEDILYDLVANEIAAILRVSKDTISRNKILKEIGLDSLMAVELGISFQQNTGFDMPLSGVADNTTVGDVARKLYEKVSKRDQGGGDDGDPGENKIVHELAQRHAGTDAEKAASQ